MIEGGASILASCMSEHIKSHLIDHVLVTVAPVFVSCVLHKYLYG
jgi:riboflavin biosynthesis pyrimidine reductase